MDNGTFVDNMLIRMQVYCKDNGMNIDIVLDDMKFHYTDGNSVFVVDCLASDEVKRINTRVKDVLDVIDPMWFVVALYHRNKGGLWRDMHKYGVKRDYVSSHNVDKPPNNEPVVYTDKFNSEGLPTL